MNRKATIISIAESTHYLVGLSDGNEVIALPSHNRVAVCNSLVEAKQLLKDHDYYSADITYQTAYDEMCGCAENLPIIETIKLK